MSFFRVLAHTICVWSSLDCSTAHSASCIDGNQVEVTDIKENTHIFGGYGIELVLSQNSKNTLEKLTTDNTGHILVICSDGDEVQSINVFTKFSGGVLPILFDTESRRDSLIRILSTGTHKYSIFFK